MKFKENGRGRRKGMSEEGGKETQENGESRITKSRRKRKKKWMK